MAHWFIIIGLVLLTVCLFIWGARAQTYAVVESFHSMGAFLALVSIVYIIIALIFYMDARQSMSVFEQQKDYLTEHTVSNEIENAALTQKKVELNEWLFTAKFVQKRLGAFSMYPEEIQQIEPIQ